MTWLKKILAFGGGNLPLILGGLVAVGAALALAYCQGRSDGRLAADNARLEANVEAMATQSAAASTAADERLADTLAVGQLEKELRDAIDDVPDSVPDAAAVALGCERLRRAGTDTTRLPACAGPEGRGQARPGP